MRRLLLGVASLIVLCALVVLSVELVVFDQNFYRSEYSKLDTAISIGIDQDDLMDATNHLLSYVRNEQNDLTMRYEVHGWDRQLFNQKEIDHMVDVRDLYLAARNVRRLGMLLLAGLLVYIFHKKAALKERLANVSKSMIDALIVMSFVVIFLVGFYFIDFDLFWTTFHKLVFTNDLWLLDPRTDILIQMVPTQFFIDCVGKIMLYTGFFLTSVLVLSILGQRVRARQLVA